MINYEDDKKEIQNVILGCLILASAINDEMLDFDYCHYICDKTYTISEIYSMCIKVIGCFQGQILRPTELDLAQSSKDIPHLLNEVFKIQYNSHRIPLSMNLTKRNISQKIKSNDIYNLWKLEYVKNNLTTLQTIQNHLYDDLTALHVNPISWLISYELPPEVTWMEFEKTIKDLFKNGFDVGSLESIETDIFEYRPGFLLNNLHYLSQLDVSTACKLFTYIRWDSGYRPLAKKIG